MEVFRGIFAEHALIRRIYALYDARKGQKDVFKTLTAIFVRLGTEKPAVIGLGHQSTLPVSDNRNAIDSDQTMLEASGVSGMISSSSGEVSHTGISTQWSSIRVPCIDQLDKTEPPHIPESYIYSLILACISSLSDGLAKFVLPLTVPNDNKLRRKASQQESERESPRPTHLEVESTSAKVRLERSASFKKNPVPINPLSLEDHPLHSEVKICSSIVDECWPAILATCSNFLYAALDSEYYHGLVRAFQRFAHVAGLLQLPVPRDAFLTTLGKSAVPPNVLTACLTGQVRPTTSSSVSDSSSSILNNARGLLSVDNLGPASPATEKQRQLSMDSTATTLNTRNLLCLRALLNLGIALGPTLDRSWSIILETLQQADLVLFTTGKSPGRTPSVNRGLEQSNENEAGSLMANFSQEVRSVETAASRLLESTVDFPNEPFVQVLQAICGLLHTQPSTTSELQPPQSAEQSPRPSAALHRRVHSFSNQSVTGSNQEFLFALAKLGEIALINIDRLLIYEPHESGWELLVMQLIETLGSTNANAPVRNRAAEVLTRLMLDSGSVSSSLPEESQQAEVQVRLLCALKNALDPLQESRRDTSVASHATDVEIHRVILEGLRDMLENCGESLIGGWDVAFDIINSVFISRESIPDEGKESGEPRTLATRSSKLVRSSFGSLQLICSDFLASLPKSCFLILVDTLYKFSSQDDDLNIALTVRYGDRVYRHALY